MICNTCEQTKLRREEKETATEAERITGTMPLHQRVIDTWAEINSIMEGNHNFLYLDVKDKPTTGIGFLVPNLKAMYELPWMSHDVNGQLRVASGAEIEAEWRWVNLKAGKKLRAEEFKRSARLFLHSGSIKQIAHQRLLKFYGSVRGEGWGQFDSWNPNIQFMCMSICWAAGGEGLLKFKNMLKAILAKDYRAAAIESHLNEIGNKGLRPRNDLHVLLCEAADPAYAQAGRRSLNNGIWTKYSDLNKWLQMSYKREASATSPLTDPKFTHNWRSLVDVPDTENETTGPAENPPTVS